MIIPATAYGAQLALGALGVTLIYGILTITAIVTPPGDAFGSFLILAAVSVASMVIGPIAAAAALRLQLQ